MRVVGQNEHFRIESEPMQGLYRVDRRSARFDTVTAMHKAFAFVHAHLPTDDRQGCVLILDIRKGSMRNDPIFEVAFARERQSMTRGFKQVVVICETVLGAAQVERHGRADGGNYRAFTDEQEALDFARTARTG